MKSVALKVEILKQSTCVMAARLKDFILILTEHRISRWSKFIGKDFTVVLLGTFEDDIIFDVVLPKVV